MLFLEDSLLQKKYKNILHFINYSIKILFWHLDGGYLHLISDLLSASILMENEGHIPLIL